MAAMDRGFKPIAFMLYSFWDFRMLHCIIFCISVAIYNFWFIIQFCLIQLVCRVMYCIIKFNNLMVNIMILVLLYGATTHKFTFFTGKSIFGLFRGSELFILVVKICILTFFRKTIGSRKTSRDGLFSFFSNVLFLVSQSTVVWDISSSVCTCLTLFGLSTKSFET